jgi:hypothetical protein
MTTRWSFHYIKQTWKVSNVTHKLHLYMGFLQMVYKWKLRPCMVLVRLKAACAPAPKAASHCAGGKNCLDPCTPPPKNIMMTDI